MAFADRLNEIPFVPSGQQATGFLPPFIRMLGHMMYVVAILGNDAIEHEDAEIQQELAAAAEHWGHRDPEAASRISTRTAAYCTSIDTLLTEAARDYNAWNPATRVTNFTGLTNRIAAFAAELDHELLGLPGSNPGRAM